MSSNRPVSRKSLIARLVFAAGLMLGGAAALVLIGVTRLAGDAAGTRVADVSAQQARIRSSFGKLPVVFEANRGQTGPEAKYLARGHGYTLFLTPDEAVFSVPLRDSRTRSRKVPLAKSGREASDTRDIAAAIIRMRMIGAQAQALLTGSDKLSGVSNYFIGSDPSKWRTNIPQFSGVLYRGIYPGIDLAFHGEESQVEFDFVVSPSADPAAVALSFAGADRMDMDASGNLVLRTRGGDLQFQRPLAYQMANGNRIPVAAGFRIADGRVGFWLGEYDRQRELIIDPVLSYSTFLGGSDEDEAGAIAVDSLGSAYIVGQTASTNFPTTAGVVQPARAGGFDAFVTKLDPSGSTRIFSTFLGGNVVGDLATSPDDSATAVALLPGSGARDVFVAGLTECSDFPGTSAGAQPDFSGGVADGFAVRLNATGTALVYSTYIGGSDSDAAFGIGADAAGNAYVGGVTASFDFPWFSSPIQTSLNGNSDGFIAKLNPTGSAYSWTTFLGGSNDDQVNGLALDGTTNPNVYVVGTTTSVNFPVSFNAFQQICGTDGSCNSGGGTPQDDAFVAEINNAGTTKVYASYLGGSKIDDGFGIAADSTGAAYVTGRTNSSDFPTHNPFQTTLQNGAQNAFVTKVSAGGTAVTFSSYLGGGGQDQGYAIAIDAAKSVFVTGQTTSTNFPVVSAVQSFINGPSDAFVSEINPAGSSVVFSTYFGGAGDENITFGGIAVDSSSNIYVAGDTTSSTGFPTDVPLQPSFGGGASDGFVARFSQAGFSMSATSAGTVTAGNSGVSTITVAPTGGFTGDVELSCVSGLPSKAACSFSTTTIAGASGTSTLTITTTGNTARLVNPLLRKESAPLYASLFPIFGLAMAGAGLAGRSTRRRVVGTMVGVLVFGGLVFLAACGGGGGGGGGNGTPPGSYNIIVQGTSGSLVTTTPVPLRVQ